MSILAGTFSRKRAWPRTNTCTLINVNNSFSFRKASCFIEKGPQKLPWENLFFLKGGGKKEKNKGK